MSTTPKHRLRWYQYSLRSLFVLTVLVAIGGSWFAVKKQQVERERAAVRAIEELGGCYVGYNYQYDASGVPIPNAKPPGPAWLRAWLGDDFFAQVVTLVWEPEGGQAVHAGFEHLEALKQLRTLHLISTRVTDTGLEHIKGLTKLKSLWLLERNVTDVGLERLKGLTQLEDLNLNGTQVTDVGLGHLQGLTQLTTLRLCGTKITDAGLAHLSGLTQLKLLVLYSTKVTNEGVKRLRQALPNCKIER
jgi:hypothetical protein